MDAAKTIKLIASIGGIAHEIGEYAAPIVKGLITRRAKGPSTSTGQELTVEQVERQIDAAIATADSIASKADAELAKRDNPNT